MTTEILVPRMSEVVGTGVIAKWLVQAGEKVEEGQVIAQIETNKPIVELNSPETCTVLHVFFAEG